MTDRQKRKGMSMEIAQRLADMRREKGLSQEELAGRLGLSRQAISKWERGESAPDMGNLIALADLYEITLDELIRGEASAVRSAKPDANAKMPASDKVDVTINTFITDEKPKVATAVPNAPAGHDAGSTSDPASQGSAVDPAQEYPPPQTPPVCEGASQPHHWPHPQSPFPPGPQAQASFRPESYSHAQPMPVAASQPVKPTSEVWMTFPYPLFCVLLYLVLGFLLGLWHPGWILFLTIPFFYWIVRVVKQDPNYIATHTPKAPTDAPREEVSGS